MPITLAPDPHATLTIARQFDQQILQCTEDEALSPAQRGELVAWAHGHLLCAYVASQLGASLQEVTVDHLACPCCGGALETISEMLQGGVPLEPETLTFQCPPLSSPHAEALRGQITAWVCGRITRAAQRTRWHADAELDALWATVEAQLIASSLRWFELTDLLEDDVPANDEMEAATQACLEVIAGKRGIAWTATGLALS